MSYDGEQMTTRVAVVTVRMHVPLAPIALGLLLAFGSLAASAQTKATDAPKAPVDLSLHTLAPLPSISSTAPALPAPQSGLPAQAVPASTSTSTSTSPAAPAPQSFATDIASASDEVRAVSTWVSQSGDNANLPYLLVDKANARVYSFSRAGQLIGSAPALLGMAKGDRLLVPNEAKMAQIGPTQRVTPAGRYVSRLAVDSHGKELLVIDYEASISLHPVVKGTPEEHRAERLASATSQDNRISYGCINVPPQFYSTIVSPSFNGTRGIVYILPETTPAAQLFGFQPAVPAGIGAATAAGTGTGAGNPPGPGALNASATQAVQAPDIR
jgi:hypothetical protein